MPEIRGSIIYYCWQFALVRINLVNPSCRLNIDIHWLDICYIGFFTIKTQQQQSYNAQQYAYSPPSTQPEQGKVIESMGINQNNYPQVETLLRRGI